VESNCRVRCTGRNVRTPEEDYCRARASDSYVLGVYTRRSGYRRTDMILNEVPNYLDYIVTAYEVLLLVRFRERNTRCAPRYEYLFNIRTRGFYLSKKISRVVTNALSKYRTVIKRNARAIPTQNVIIKPEIITGFARSTRNYVPTFEFATRYCARAVANVLYTRRDTIYANMRCFVDGQRNPIR